jgi:hypothetical protein
LVSLRLYSFVWRFNMDTIEVRVKKRNWYLLGLLFGFALGFLTREVITSWL